VSAVSDHGILRQNLLASPAVAREEVPVKLYENQRSAARAYNLALSEAPAEIVIFAHQDVYLPESYLVRLRALLRVLASRNESWAVLGVFGAAANGELTGWVWSSGLGRQLGGPFTEPVPVVSVDELVIVVRRSSGIRFDEGLPGFHLYGTDVVQAALSAGFGAFVVPTPVVHNSRPVVRLGDDYWSAYRHLARRWRERLPIATCTSRIAGGPWCEIRYRLTSGWRLLRQRPTGARQADPAAIASRLGY